MLQCKKTVRSLNVLIIIAYIHDFRTQGIGYSMRKETPLDNNSDTSIVISEDDCTNWRRETPVEELDTSLTGKEEH